MRVGAHAVKDIETLADPDAAHSTACVLIRSTACALIRRTRNRR